MSMGYKTLQNSTDRFSEKIQTLEIDYQNLLKRFEKLADRTSFLEDNLHATQTITKDENLSLMEKIKDLESYVQDEN